jgi:anion-transporting  ArsA/GET3 family ATPase
MADTHTPWQIWKRTFYAWENHTAKYIEGMLQSPLMLGPSGKMLGQMMKAKASSNKAMTTFWGNMGLPTKHDQERMLHALNQLQSRIYDLEEKLEDATKTKEVN